MGWDYRTIRLIIDNDNISICIVPFARGYTTLLPVIRYQENLQSLASPKGAAGLVHTLSPRPIPP